jgi:hypothetical protein
MLHGKCTSTQWTRYCLIVPALNALINFNKLKSHYLQNSKLSEASIVVEVPDSSYKKSVPGRLGMTLQFVSANIIVLADGAGTLHVMRTGLRASGGIWEVAFY